MPEMARDPDPAQSSGNQSADDPDDVFVILARRSEVDSIADQMKEEFTKQGETLESLLRAAREIRDASGGGTAPR